MRTSADELLVSVDAVSASDLRVERRAGVRLAGVDSTVGEGGVEVLVGDDEVDVFVSLVGEREGGSDGSGNGRG